MRIDGKEIASKIKAEVKIGVQQFTQTYQAAPSLVVIVVGNDPASQVYVRNKHRACEELGINSIELSLPEDTTETELLMHIDTYNHRDDVHGILVQLPLPSHIREAHIIESITPEKDVDGFHPINLGKMFSGAPGFVPCTPAGIIELLQRSEIDIAGKHAVVVGRSNIVGKPIAQLLLQKNATVTMCHSRTKDLSSYTKQADILVVAIGKAGFITRDMIKPGAVVIDVGINRSENGKLCGDVAYNEVEQVASAITPVPGGVGPMTIALLMKNTLLAAQMTQN